MYKPRNLSNGRRYAMDLEPGEHVALTRDGMTYTVRSVYIEDIETGVVLQLVPGEIDTPDRASVRLVYSASETLHAR